MVFFLYGKVSREGDARVIDLGTSIVYVSNKKKGDVKRIFFRMIH